MSFGSLYVFFATFVVICVHLVTSQSTISPSDLSDNELEGLEFEFESSSTIFLIGIGLFIVLISIFIGVVYHRDSKAPALRFITRRSAYPFYVAAIVSIFSVLIIVWFVDDLEGNTVTSVMIGIVVIGTAAVVGSVSVIGCKYYRSFLCWRCLRYIHMNGKIFAISGYCLVIVVVVFDCIFFFLYQLKEEYYKFVSYSHLILILFASIASLASKIAQIQWILLVAVYILMSSTNFPVWWLFWESLACIYLSVISLFFFSPYGRLGDIFFSIQSSLIYTFDIATDVAVIWVWFKLEGYWEAVLQMIFIFVGWIFSSYFIDDYYYIHESAEDQNKEISNRISVNIDENDVLRDINEERKRRIFCGRLFTCLGLGRIFHGIFAWDEENKDMVMGTKILRVWEMIFKSFPTIVLQTYIQMRTRKISTAIVLSLLASFSSITFTLIIVLYKDHHSNTRIDDMKIQERIHDLIKVGQPRSSTVHRGIVGVLDRKHENVLKLQRRGFDIQDILQAWVQLKTNLNPEIANATEDNEHFMSDMTYILKNIRDMQTVVHQSSVELEIAGRSLNNQYSSGAHVTAGGPDDGPYVTPGGPDDDGPYVTPGGPTEDPPSFSSELMETENEERGKIENISTAVVAKDDNFSIIPDGSPPISSKEVLPIYAINTNDDEIMLEIEENANEKQKENIGLEVVLSASESPKLNESEDAAADNNTNIATDVEIVGPSVPSSNAPKPMINPMSNFAEDSIAGNAGGRSSTNSIAMLKQKSKSSATEILYVENEELPDYNSPLIWGGEPELLNDDDHYQTPGGPDPESNDNISGNYQGGPELQDSNANEHGGPELQLGNANEHRTPGGPELQLSNANEHRTPGGPHQEYNSVKQVKMISPTLPRVRSGTVDTGTQIYLDSINIDEIYVDFSHPNVSAMYYQGYDEDTIKRVFHMLKMKKKRKNKKINVDSFSFVTDMEAIMKEFCIEPENNIGQQHNSKYDILWRNFICFFWCHFLYKCQKKKNKELPGLQNESSKKKKRNNLLYIFYLQVYFFILTDFYVQMYPFLLFGIMFGILEYTLAVISFYIIFEYCLYFYILEGEEFKNLKYALKYFWVGMYSCSYWFLSAMHLTYLPCNVDFHRLMKVQVVRLIVQALFMIVLVVLEYGDFIETDTRSDFLPISILFVVGFLVNCTSIYYITKSMKLVRTKIVFDSTLK